MTLVRQERTRAVAAVAAPAPVLPSRILHPFEYRRAIDRLDRDYRHRDALARRLYDCLVGLSPDLVYRSSTVLGASIEQAPLVLSVDYGPPLTYLVRMLPGQTLAQFQQHADDLAECMEAVRVLMTRERGGLLRIELHDDDPLDTPIDAEPAVLASPDGLVLLGIDEVATRYRISPLALGHTVIQGQTRAGKTAFTYWLLSQFASAPDLIVAGCDPTRLLLRPFEGTVHEPWQVCGARNIDAHIDLLRALVAEMDGRIDGMPPRQDHIVPGPDCPLIVVVLEEYAGLLRAAQEMGGGSGRSSPKMLEIQRLVGRLVAEGHKAAMRVVIIVQRAETTILGGFERGQCAVRISFRVDNADSVVMLHPHARAEAERHASCPPGQALLSAPGLKLARIRAPFLGEPLYPNYLDLIDARAERLAA